MTKFISIIIPNYNGKKLLEKNLPSLIDNTKGSEIIIVDDGSKDDSIQFIQEAYPTIKIIRLNRNRGFSFAVNQGVKEARNEIVYILNSDVEVCQGFLEPIAEHFKKENVFAVSSTELNSDSNETVIPLVKFKWGIFWYWYESLNFNYPNAIEVFCVSGGHTAFDREKFIKLGGFDTLFYPFYGEDGDICWRASKFGWKCLIEPKSLVKHEYGKTIGVFYTKNQVLTIHWQNRFLMTWKIITSKWLLFKHVFFLPAELMVFPFLGKSEFAKGFGKAFMKLPKLIQSRTKAVIKEERFGDVYLFKRFSHKPKFPPFNILYIHETSHFSGAENSLLNLVENINKEMFRPFFVLPEKGDFSAKLEKIGVDLDFIEMPRLLRLKKAIKTIIALLDLIKEKKIDLIHSNSIRTNIYGAIVAKLNRIPIIWHQRNLITNEAIDPDRLLSFLPDKIICNSKAIARRFKKGNSLAKKVVLVYNGVNLKRFNPNVTCKSAKEEFKLNEDYLTIGIASRFSEGKGHEYFLNEACLIKKAVEDKPEIFEKKIVKFLVIGGAVFKEAEYRERYLRELSDKLGLSDSVIFCGFRNDMPELFSLLDVLVLASKAEPCGRVLFEAMASGKPIVATNTGGTSEIVPDSIAGILFPPYKRGALSGSVIQLLSNRKKALQIGAAGRKWVEENFSIEKNVRETEKVYSELLSWH